MADALKLATLIALLAACSARTTPSVRDSNSNWLATCDVTADCSGDGSCICGLCTATCRDDGDCERAGPGASCVRPDEASDEVACAAIVQAAAQNVCLAECADDGDCRDGSMCRDGACWASPSAVIDQRDGAMEPLPDAGVASRPDAEPTPPLGHEVPADIWQLDAAVDFGEPTARPEPELEVQGTGAASLIGVWRDQPGHIQFWGSPVTLEIVQDATTQRITGTLSFSCETGPGCEFTDQPLPPVTDPDAAYPPGLPAGTLQEIRINILPFFPHRIFDARLEDGRLAFWLTSNEPWRDWCPLQSPYPSMVDGLARYACVPNARGYQELQLDPDADAKDVLCSSDFSPCRCTASGCALDYHSAVRSMSLERVDDDTLQGFYIMSGDAHAVTLKRQAAP